MYPLKYTKIRKKRIKVTETDDGCEISSTEKKRTQEGSTIKTR